MLSFFRKKKQEDKTELDVLNEMATKLFTEEWIMSANRLALDISLFENSVTLVPKDPSVSAYNLKPCSGIVKVVNHGSVLDDSKALLRLVLPTILAKEIVKNEAAFNFIMSVYINEGLKTLIKTLGTTVNRRIILSRPGQGNVFFIQLTHADDAYEFRIYVE